jgi:hypothetical protein
MVTRTVTPLPAEPVMLGDSSILCSEPHFLLWCVIVHRGPCSDARVWTEVEDEP